MRKKIPTVSHELDLDQFIKKLEQLRKTTVPSDEVFRNDLLILSSDNIQKLVKSARKAMNSTQENVSDVSGVALKTVQKIEHGELNINLQNFKRVLDVLGIEICLRKK